MYLWECLIIGLRCEYRQARTGKGNKFAWRRITDVTPRQLSIRLLENWIRKRAPRSFDCVCFRNLVLSVRAFRLIPKLQAKRWRLKLGVPPNHHLPRNMRKGPFLIRSRTAGTMTLDNSGGSSGSGCFGSEARLQKWLGQGNLQIDSRSFFSLKGTARSVGEKSDRKSCS